MRSADWRPDRRFSKTVGGIRAEFVLHRNMAARRYKSSRLVSLQSIRRCWIRSDF